MPGQEPKAGENGRVGASRTRCCDLGQPTVWRFLPRASLYMEYYSLPHVHYSHACRVAQVLGVSVVRVRVAAEERGAAEKLRIAEMQKAELARRERPERSTAVDHPPGSATSAGGDPATDPQAGQARQTGAPPAPLSGIRGAHRRAGLTCSLWASGHCTGRRARCTGQVRAARRHPRHPS